MTNAMAQINRLDEDGPQHVVVSDADRITISIANEQLLLMGEGVLAVCFWSPKWTGNVVNLQLLHQRVRAGDAWVDRYILAVWQGSASRAEMLLAFEDATEAQKLIERIQASMRAYLGFPLEPARQPFDLHPDAHTEKRTAAVVDGPSRALVAAFMIFGAALIGALGFVVPFMAQAGHHLAMFLGW